MDLKDKNEGLQLSNEIIGGELNLPIIMSQLAQLMMQQKDVSGEDQTLDVKEAAAFLRVSTWMIYDMVRKKKIPFFRIGSRIFFRKKDLEMMITEQVQNNVNLG
ncbi:helix-turn-helix domain-containing protein [Paenibacillus macerans]|uniref:helix-turn-helix domain-containing protein n=1 Tax=Paenibacillus macerans TaxID=44252 RepID=UPI0022E6D8F8|nr:helix-turn-helix domain-containing protein [Paenibacillus macerans]